MNKKTLTIMIDELLQFCEVNELPIAIFIEGPFEKSEGVAGWYGEFKKPLSVLSFIVTKLSEPEWRDTNVGEKP